MKKFLAFGDLHYGYDKVIDSTGRVMVQPVHDVKAFQCMMKFAKVFKPDIVMMMGDVFNMQPVSRHVIHDSPKKIEGQRLVQDYQEGNEFFLKPILSLGAETHWFDGNHEAWAYQLVTKFPGIDGLVDPYTYLEMKKRGIHFHKQGEFFKLGKLAFHHGDNFVKGSVRYVAQRAVEKYGSSIRVWHFHTYQVYTRETLKNNAYQTGMAIPCLCNRGPAYDTTQFNSWMHGFLYGYIEPNGSFHDNVSVIWKGKTVAEGKVYDANK